MSSLYQVQPGCSHVSGDMTLIIEGVITISGNTSIAIHFCRNCGQAFTNDTHSLTQMNPTDKTALSGRLNQLPTGAEIFTQLQQRIFNNG